SRYHRGGPTERHHREDLALEVVVDEEIARETRAGELRLVPAAVCVLRANQVGDAALERRATLAVGDEAEERPRSLRGRRVADARPLRIVVRTHVLAPAAVVVLMRLEPFDRAANGGVLFFDAV